MATQPNNPIVRVALQDTILPSTQLNNKILPSTSVINVGYDANELVAAENLNYIFDNFGKWLTYLKEVGDSQIMVGNGLVSDSATIGEGQTISLGTPSTLNASTTNQSTTDTHSHEVATASDLEAQVGTDTTKFMTAKSVNKALDMVGMLVFRSVSTTPSGRWVKGNGAELSRSAYNDLFLQVSGSSNYIDQSLKNSDPVTYAGYYGTGNGTTTFTLPDYRSEFFRVWDEGRGVDTGRTFASFQAEQTNNFQEVAVTNNNNYVFSTTIPDNGDWSAWVNTGEESGGAVDRASRFRVAGVETRPRNIAVTAWIRY